MPNWIEITVDNLNNAKVAALVDALRTSALADGQTDRAPEIIQNVVNRIRIEVQACKANTVDSDTSKIPAELLALAVRLVLWDLKNSLEIEVTEAERIDHANDETFLKRIAACEVPISTPENPIAATPVQSANNSPRFGPRTRKFTSTTQDGI